MFTTRSALVPTFGNLLMLLCWKCGPCLCQLARGKIGLALYCASQDTFNDAND